MHDSITLREIGVRSSLSVASDYFFSPEALDLRLLKKKKIARALDFTLGLNIQMLTRNQVCADTEVMRYSPL